MSSTQPECVVDTVVLRYFLLVGEENLLVRLLGSPIGTSRIVYDPAEQEDVPEPSRSEMTRSVAYQRRASADPAHDALAQEQAATNAERLGRVAEIHASGRLVVLDLTAAEVGMFSRLTSAALCPEFGLRFPLDAGEAACLAIAVGRGMTLATDDADALRALDQIATAHPNQRIRRLLVAAAESALVTRDRANAIHREMRRLGFWDNADTL